MKISATPPSTPARVSSRTGLQRWLQRLTGETRTRILLLYATSMLLVMAAAVPIFRFFLFAEVNQRVREDLREELDTFQSKLDAASPETEADLMVFIDGFLGEDLPEDDNFHIVVLNDEFYRATPIPLPTVIQPDSEIMQQWFNLREPTREIVPVPDPAVDSVLYKTHVLEVDGTFIGQFIVAHLAAGERAESLAGVYVFIKIATAGVIFSFLLAWLGSRQLLKPVQRLAETARGINELNLSQRLEVEGTGELAALASTFNAMMDRVQAAFDSQRNFVNDAGHELRTPITIIQGHLELMDDDPEEQRETLEIVMDELDRMGRFVNDLVLLAKADRPDFLQPETLDLASFTEVVFGKMTALDKRNWQLVNIGHGKFVADRQRITGALLNLAQNATQHTQPTDTIELGSSLSKGRVRFWVHDTGEGIAPADQQRIFDRFARAANSYRRSEGAGLGLAIVSAIAEAHKGHVELTSQLGVGSTFSLILPL
ncbi:MAG: ATP-binding protein [Cyanobacteria bacterium J06626_18]